MKKTLFLILAAVLCAGSAWAISADLGEVGVGARPLAIGKAYTGFSEDTSAIFLNPAGLTESKNFGLVSMTGKLLEEITYVSIGVSNPVPVGIFGFGYINAATSGIPLTTLTRTTTEVLVNQYGVTDYSSSIMYFTLAREFMTGLSAGGSLKLFSQGFSADSGSMEGSSGTGIDADLGMRWKPMKGIAMGAMLQNLLPMNAGGKFIWKKGYEEGIPAAMKLGGSFKIWGDDGIAQFRGQRLMVDLDCEMNMASRPGIWRLGSEWWATSILAIRLGIDQKAKATATGIGIDNNLTGGVGIKYKGFSFDYAYHQYGELTENAAHFFSIGFSGEKEEPTALETARQKLKDEDIIKTQLRTIEGIKKFSDVPADYWAKDPIEYLATLGMIGGYPDGTFKPENSLTRAELAAVLVKAKGFKVSKPLKDPFSDLSKNHWAAPYIQMAVQRKYMSGYPDGKFRAWKMVSRAEAIIVMSKFAGLSEPSTISSNPFPDVQKKHWAARFISAAKQAGMLEYLSGGSFDPEKAFSRAEACEVLSKTPFAKDQIKQFLKK